MTHLRTEVQILQCNRLDVNSFLSSKTLEANQKLHQYFWGSTANFREVFT